MFVHTSTHTHTHCALTVTHSQCSNHDPGDLNPAEGVISINATEPSRACATTVGVISITEFWCLKHRFRGRNTPPPSPHCTVYLVEQCGSSVCGGAGPRNRERAGNYAPYYMELRE